jgi:hypothetical protein
MCTKWSHVSSAACPDGCGLVRIVINFISWGEEVADNSDKGVQLVPKQGTNERTSVGTAGNNNARHTIGYVIIICLAVSLQRSKRPWSKTTPQQQDGSQTLIQQHLDPQKRMSNRCLYPSLSDSFINGLLNRT